MSSEEQENGDPEEYNGDYRIGIGSSEVVQRTTTEYENEN
jgi:hypothetical protein